MAKTLSNDTKIKGVSSYCLGEEKDMDEGELQSYLCAQ
jgi:hypothetical protein